MITGRPIILILAVLFTITSTPAKSSEHPKLIMTRAGVEEIRRNLGKVPLFDTSVARARKVVDAEIEKGIQTPVPKDFSGGYTHERHKRNFIIAQKAGALYQILQDEKYAEYVRDMLLQYEAMYSDLPVHPKERSYARGKLFWQCLNDSNWLVYMSQAYDAIYDWLPRDQREQLNDNLFRPFADFISIGNPQFYNRIHNHSTWGNVAVGMIGLVMDDEELIERALYGIEDDGLQTGVKDDDGGFIKVDGQRAGFLANLDEPFSPDGYYTEGPYYQRYAMYPFLIFALAMHNANPEMEIFKYKNGVLLKAVDTLLNLSDADGEFFPLNDAQKGMSYYSRSLVAAIDIAYFYGQRNPQFLSIAKQQSEVLLNQAGLSVAMDIHDGKAEPFRKESVNYSDGPEGNQGGVAIIRAGESALSLVFKYTAQGLSHGHYDKLSFSLYDRGAEVLQDYGLVRFVNIEQKGGGNYLKENQSWAKQTIAHNTLIQNGTSHFEGKYEEGVKFHSELYFFEAGREHIQIVSAKDTNAYPGTTMHRTMAMVRLPGDDKPVVIDLMKVLSSSNNQYDLPYYFMGQVLDTTFDYEIPDRLEALGGANGYQHLYLEGLGRPSSDSIQFTWLSDRKFYTLTAAVQQQDKLLFTRLGANDPDFNLRRDAALMIRREDVGNTVFASVIEPHGSYSPVSELSVNSNSAISGLQILFDNRAYTALAVERKERPASVFIVTNRDASTSTKHQLELSGKTYRWQGPYHLADQ